MKIFRVQALRKGKRSAMRTRQMADWGIKNQVSPMAYSSRSYAEDVAARAAKDLGFDIEVYEQEVPGAKRITEAVEIIRRSGRK